MAGYPGGTYQGQERWWQKKGDDLGRTVWAIAGSLESDQGFRRNRDRESLALYEGRKLRGMHAGAYTLEAQYQEYDLNVTRAACDTLHSEIAGRQKPTANFQTSDADWKTKRRAKKLGRFNEAILHQTQGPYLNAWELMEDVFLDAAIWGVGVAKVFAQSGKIKIERHFNHELFVDPVEARYGDPKNLFHIYTMERDQAIHAFALDPALKLSKQKRQEIQDAIETAEEVDPEVYGSNPRVAKAVKIVEAWRLRHEDGTPGLHIFCISNKTLYEEPWERDSFPFVRLLWEKDRMGWHGKGLVEQGEAIHRELNQNAVRLQERFRLCGSKRTYIQEGSVDLEDMQANEAEVLIEYKQGSEPPKENVPKPIADAEFTWYSDAFNKYFEITGVSQMRASARKEPGVTAGVAIRTLNDMQTARFALKAKAYENAYVQLAQQIIQCVREVAQDGFSVRYDEEIDWKDVELPENTFSISIAPASALPNDPAGRLQMAQELFQAQVIGVETFKQLLGWPDLEKEMNNQTAQVRYIEKVLDRILDIDDEDDVDHFEPPDPFIIDKVSAFLQASQAYLDALYDGAPELNLDLLRRWLEMLDAQMASGAEAMQQEQVRNQATMAAMPSGGQAPPPGAPGPM
jgi:hypothetical protein